MRHVVMTVSFRHEGMCRSLRRALAMVVYREVKIDIDLNDLERAWALHKAKQAAQAGKACAQCGKPVEVERECYAIPTCYACLPPPEPLPVRKAAQAGKGDGE